MKPLTVEHAIAKLEEARDAGDTIHIMYYGAMVDRFDAEKPKLELAPSAIWYASQGLYVFPLSPRSKIPRKGSAGCKDATNDVDQVRAWWAATPDANIGLATGRQFDVIDIDGPEGVVSYARMENVPTIYGTVDTPRAGGSHHYIAHHEGEGNSAHIFPGVDIRGTGGYVVAPPSINADGIAYTWTRPLNVEALCDPCST